LLTELDHVRLGGHGSILANSPIGARRHAATHFPSRSTTVREPIEDSLSRLDTDYIDLRQIHRFDPNTPVEETMEALDDVVKAGKARYICRPRSRRHRG